MGHKTRKAKRPAHQEFLESGAFLRDITTLGDALSPYKVEPAIISAMRFSDLLPKEQRKAFRTLVSLVEGGSLPSISHFRPKFSFGQDVLTRHGGAYSTTRGLRFLQEPKDWLEHSFPLATDGSFNLHVLVADGRVAVLSREEEGC